MKKMNVTTMALLALPLMMVFVASNPSGVMVFDGTNVTMLSWFQMVPEAAFGWCAPAAGLLNYVIFGMAGIYAVLKKDWCLKGIFGIALAAVCIAVLPIVARPEIKIVPSVLGAILLSVESGVAYAAMKKAEPAKEEKKNGKRLKKR